MRPTSWVPPLLWMGVILWLASDSGSAEHTGRLIEPILRYLFPLASPLQIEAMHGTLRKLAHVTEYAILVGLWFRAFMERAATGVRASAWRAWMIAVGWAVIDETYQFSLLSRTGSPFDVLIDAAGGLAVAIPAGYGWRPTADRLADILLWIAALGGAAFLALNVIAGVPSGVLWLTAPAALIALALLRRRRPSAPPRP